MNENLIYQANATLMAKVAIPAFMEKLASYNLEFTNDEEKISVINFTDLLKCAIDNYLYRCENSEKLVKKSWENQAIKSAAELLNVSFDGGNSGVDDNIKSASSNLLKDPEVFQAADFLSKLAADMPSPSQDELANLANMLGESEAGEEEVDEELPSEEESDEEEEEEDIE